MTVSVVIPFGADLSPEGLHRQRVWSFILPMWLDLMSDGVVDDLVIADDPLRRQGAEWSTARALRAGVPQTTGDIIVQYGADHIPDGDVIRRAAELLTMQGGGEYRRHHWTHLYRDVEYATQESTLAVLDAFNARRGHDVSPYPNEDVTGLEWGARSGCCVGMWAFTRRAWRETGGVDPRFVGWGYGDDAWNRVLEAAYGPSPAPPGGVLRELWHPAAYRVAGAENPNQRLYTEEYVPLIGNKDALLKLQEKWS